MNKKKTTLKGFTLIELIIVLAIFSVIMTLVMSFIDPVSKLMTKTSVRERTAAYVDNINEYVSKSIRHAQNIWVYENGLNGDTEEELVKDFVNTYYDGAVALDGTNLVPMNLKVHVLKLINEDEGELKSGRIYESVYDLEAGKGTPGFKYLDKNTYKEVTSFPPGMDDDAKEAAYIKAPARKYDGVNFKEADIKNKILNTPVINDEHFKDYSYYYKLGMYTFDPIKDSLDSYSDLTEDSSYFYSRLNKMMKNGSEISDGVDGYQVVMNVVSFTHNNKINSVHTIGEGSSATTEDLIAFKSPAAMNSVGITFKNVQLQKSTGNVVSYYREKLKSTGSGDYDYEVEKEDGKTLIEPVKNKDMPISPFRRITEGTSDNIYMIFTVPTEIMDTEWKDLPEPTTAPESESGKPPTALI